MKGKFEVERQWGDDNQILFLFFLFFIFLNKCRKNLKLIFQAVADALCSFE